jgi:hypothetical protein
MNNFIANNWFKIVIAFTIFLIGISFFYSYALKPILDKPKLEKCLNDAHDLREKRWKEWCKIDGKEIGTDGLCLNSQNRYDYANKLEQDTKDECFKKYPQK